MTTVEKIQHAVRDLPEDKLEIVLSFVWSLSYQFRREQSAKALTAKLADPNFDPNIDWTKDDFSDWPGFTKPAQPVVDERKKDTA